MSAIIFSNPVIGTIVESGDQLYFYEVGTTTDLEVYADFALSNAATQPIVADAEGRFPPIYIDSTGGDPKIVLEDSNDVEKWTCERYPINDLTALSLLVAQNASAIDALEGDVATAEANIEALQADSIDHGERISALEGVDEAVDYSAVVPRAMGSVTGGSSPVYGQKYGVTDTVTRVGSGQYDITFSVARPTNKYIIVTTGGQSPEASPLDITFAGKTTAGFRVETWYTTGGSTRDKVDRDFDFVVWDMDQ